MKPASTPAKSTTWPQLPRPVNWQQMSKGSNMGTLGRKFCTKCGRWRYLLDFGAASRNGRGTCIRLQAHCLTCQRIRNRVTNGHTQRRIGQMSHRERLDRHNELYRQRLADDPALAAERREYDRAWKEAKRRRDGVPARPIGPRVMREPIKKDTKGEAVDARPFLEWVKRWQATNAGIESIDNLAKKAGTDSSRIRAMRRADAPRVSVGLVDRFLIAAGGNTMLSHLYPEH